ncbi:hypothetical protein GCM10009411_12030 [Shewanella litoralis]|uniref:Uncharacterized protein n=1 Tax=Shewanella litoralis TaxID=2282700 RepID=A0ABQ2R7R6_9GAMM|nr:hypothetical protein GCM10009411_12030 [Shewanella litoralis]
MSCCSEIGLHWIAYRLSLIAYRLSLIAYRLSFIAYRLSLIAYRLEDTEFPLNDQIISRMAIISLNEFSKITQRDQLERRIDLEYQQCIYLPKCLWEYARMDFLSTEPVV